MTRKALDNCIFICSYIGIFVFIFNSFAHHRMLQAVFFTWMTLPLALQAYRAELKRREENEYQIYQPNNFEKITGYGTPVFFILFAAGSFTLGVLIFFRII